MYGSDNHSSTLFDGSAGAWNLGSLDTILRRRIRKVMPGAEIRWMCMLHTVVRACTA
jgi:hypothetical protein